MIELQDIKLIDLIPQNLRDDPTIIAAAEAIDQQLREVTAIIPNVSLFHRIDHLPSEWIDQLAYQWHVDFYDPNLPLEQRRELVKNSLVWHKHKGTPAAVEELIATVFGTGEVKEWFEYGGLPGYFKVSTSDPTASTDKANEFIAAINSIKNARSWLESIEITTIGNMSLRYGFATHIGKTITARQVV